MPKVIITVGLPASGKSTKYRELAKDPAWKRLNKDDMRAMLDNSVWSKENEQLMNNLRMEMLESLLNDGYNVILDDTNLHLPSLIGTVNDIVGMMDQFSEVEIEIDDSFLDVPPGELIDRDYRRQGRHKVGKEVIERMFNQYKDNIVRKVYKKAVKEALDDYS